MNEMYVYIVSVVEQPYNIAWVDEDCKCESSIAVVTQLVSEE